MLAAQWILAIELYIKSVKAESSILSLKLVGEKI